MSILISALNESGVGSAITNYTAWTILAPNNAAFEKTLAALNLTAQDLLANQVRRLRCGIVSKEPWAVSVVVVLGVRALLFLGPAGQPGEALVMRHHARLCRAQCVLWLCGGCDACIAVFTAQDLVANQVRQWAPCMACSMLLIFLCSLLQGCGACITVVRTCWPTHGKALMLLSSMGHALNSSHALHFSHAHVLCWGCNARSAVFRTHSSTR
jgi:hypothetical protein